MTKIKIADKEYEVIESFGWQAGGMLAVIVKDGDNKRTAVKEEGRWRFWTIKDKMRPGGYYTGMGV